MAPAGYIAILMRIGNLQEVIHKGRPHRGGSSQYGYSAYSLHVVCRSTKLSGLLLTTLQSTFTVAIETVSQCERFSLLINETYIL